MPRRAAWSAGRLVKLLGDGAMLRLRDATVGVEAALELVQAMTGEGGSRRTPGSTPVP
jgi:hypothetical protein